MKDYCKNGSEDTKLVDVFVYVLKKGGHSSVDTRATIRLKDSLIKLKQIDGFKVSTSIFNYFNCLNSSCCSENYWKANATEDSNEWGIFPRFFVDWPKIREKFCSTKSSF